LNNFYIKLKYIFLTKFRFWSFDDEYTPWDQDNLYLVPSESSIRVDLKAIESGDYNLAQKSKDDYENLQRADKKIREKKK
jgi:hypothetical protein